MANYSINRQDRFWSKVNIRECDECWPWMASVNRDGYGKFKDRGTVINASRAAWARTSGQTLTALERSKVVVRHTCDNPRCCNPSHLVQGSQGDNMADMKARGRGRAPSFPGFSNPNVKLSPRQLSEIRGRISAGEGNRSIARDYPVSDSLISRIRTGRSWANGGS